MAVKLGHKNGSRLYYRYEKIWYTFPDMEFDLVEIDSLWVDCINTREKWLYRD